MRGRSLVALVGLVGLLAVPIAGADEVNPDVAASAKGSIHWIIPLPNDFGVEIANRLSVDARKLLDGTVRGHFRYVQTVEGESFKFNVDVTCIGTYDGNRAKVGGVITKSNDPTQPPGKYAWFQVFDNGKKRHTNPPDRSSLVGFGDEAQNEAFCASPNLPRFGPWDVKGDVKVVA